MLNDATCFKAVYIVCGYTDLRSGMDRLAALVEMQTGNRPYVPDTLYLFCGRRTDRIKGLVWEGDGWLLLYKRLSESRFQWPRNPDEVRALTPQQFRWLMEGLTGGTARIYGIVFNHRVLVQNSEIFRLLSCINGWAVFYDKNGSCRGFPVIYAAVTHVLFWEKLY